ncbi:MAG: HAD-IA family hydrolase [Chloroflexi bacterium]|nr:HAD-IA family hydrolase [Chloroflexota bacterium]
MMLIPPLQGILFDFDGLILDTETSVFRAWEDKFKEYGKELLIEEWAEILGKSGEELGPIEDFLNGLPGDINRQKIFQEVKKRELSLVKDRAPLPGVEELISKAKSAGLKLGIVSSSDQEWVHSHLTRLGLFDLFDHTSCFDEVDEAKPNPALYHLGLKKMNIKPEKVLVFEDSPNGVLAAKRAGLFCIAVPNGITIQLPYFPNGGKPDLILKSLEEFPWDEFMREHQ